MYLVSQSAFKLLVALGLESVWPSVQILFPLRCVFQLLYRKIHIVWGFFFMTLCFIFSWFIFHWLVSRFIGYACFFSFFFLNIKTKLKVATYQDFTLIGNDVIPSLTDWTLKEITNWTVFLKNSMIKPRCIKPPSCLLFLLF